MRKGEGRGKAREWGRGGEGGRQEKGEGGGGGRKAREGGRGRGGGRQGKEEGEGEGEGKRMCKGEGEGGTTHHTDIYCLFERIRTVDLHIMNLVPWHTLPTPSLCLERPLPPTSAHPGVCP